GQS
ncbi:hypothetical protein CP8484711_1200B, partial [Chlamydia psittaci 84-8471/1]